MRTLRLAAIQPPQETGDSPAEAHEQLVGRALELLEEAASQGAGLALLPEVFSTPRAGAPSDYAESDEGPLCARLCDLARSHRMGIVAPVHEMCSGRLRNAAWVISPRGVLVGHYHKVHPTRGEMRKGVVAGDEWPVFEIDSVRVGVMICHDNSFPESARCLALAGAELICWPHVQSGWGDTVWDITLRSRAIDNGAYLLTSCYGMAEGGRAWRPGMMVGRSGVVAPDGMILSETGRWPGIATTTIDFDRALIKHDFSHSGDHEFRTEMLADRRPDTYRILAEEGVASRAD
jgi:predicted amidohydrolase